MHRIQGKGRCYGEQQGTVQGTHESALVHDSVRASGGRGAGGTGGRHSGFLCWCAIHSGFLFWCAIHFQFVCWYQRNSWLNMHDTLSHMAVNVIVQMAVNVIVHVAACARGKGMDKT